MTGSSVEVCPEAVQELAVAIDNFSAKVTYLMETTDAEIKGELDMMDGICEQIRKKWETAKQLLEEAKNRLYEAERELQACEASQTKDEDGNWHPSCAGESAAVEAARREVSDREDEEYKWRQNYERACKIVDWQKSCVREFWKEPGIIVPPGHGWELKYIGGKYSEERVAKLDECLEQLGIYEETNLSLDVKHAVDSGAMKEPEPVLCPNCGRPIRNCVCRRFKKD